MRHNKGMDDKNKGSSKIVDLKPRESRAHSQFGHFDPNDELLQSTTRVKSQRDVILDRIQKMNEAREKVSQAVYEKVKRDYALQLDTITEILNEKKFQLKEEIKKLYMNREKLSFEINRHKEILEEAEFRHYLEEFTQVQYQEVENFETKEIEKLESDLSNINQWIKIHEELFDRQDFGEKEKQHSASQKEEKKFESKFSKFQKDVPETVTKKITGETSSPSDDFQYLFEDEQESSQGKFGRTEDNIEALLNAEKTNAPQQEKESSEQDNDVMIPEPSEEDYYKKDRVDEASFRAQKKLPSFEEESVTVDKKMGLDEEENTEGLAKQVEKKKTALSATKPAQKIPVTKDDSISEILDSIKLDDEDSESSGAIDLSPKKESFSPSYKLTVIQGETDTKEFILGENTSIGRSPSNDIPLKEPKVSRQHAAINKYNESYILIDLKSSNGVYVNGTKIDEVVLNPGDEISIGGHKFLFEKI